MICKPNINLIGFINIKLFVCRAFQIRVVCLPFIEFEKFELRATRGVKLRVRLVTPARRRSAGPLAWWPTTYIVRYNIYIIHNTFISIIKFNFIHKNQPIDKRTYYTVFTWMSICNANLCSSFSFCRVRTSVVWEVCVCASSSFTSRHLNCELRVFLLFSIRLLFAHIFCAFFLWSKFFVYFFFFFCFAIRDIHSQQCRHARVIFNQYGMLFKTTTW